jgi:hypothetical protein
LIVGLLCGTSLAHAESVVNPAVTQATIAETISVQGYSRTVRPPSGYARGIKWQLIEGRGLGIDAMLTHRLDQIVLLCLGGDPRGPRRPPIP